MQEEMKQAELFDAASFAQESVQVEVKPKRGLQMPVQKINELLDTLAAKFSKEGAAADKAFQESTRTQEDSST